MFLNNSGSLKNNNFIKYLINSKKKSKKCKIWFASTYSNGDHVEWFGSTVRILKTQILSRSTEDLYATRSKLAISYTHTSRWFIKFICQICAHGACPTPSLYYLLIYMFAVLRLVFNCFSKSRAGKTGEDKTMKAHISKKDITTVLLIMHIYTSNF